MSSDSPWQPKAVSGPALHHPRASWLTYESFYGLKDKPFSLASDPAFFYNSRAHAKAFEDLQSGIRRRESLSVLSGDIGTGKTTLCRAVLQKLDQKTFSAFVPDPFASREDLLKVVLMDFGVVSADDLMSGRLKTASRTELSYLLYEFLGTLSPLQAFAVVFIDEAQNLSVPLLEEIRILSDSDGRERQLQVVLVGQLELQDKLRLPEMRQVDQRVSVRCTLAPLDQAGVAGYVAHRLEVAGGRSDRVSFSADAIAAVYEASGGVPRLINRICDRALHQGHVKQTAIITRDIVAIAIADVGVAPVAPAALTGVVMRVREVQEQRPTPEPVSAYKDAETYESPVQTYEPAQTYETAPAAEPAPSVPEYESAPASEPVDNWFARVDRSVGMAAATVPSGDARIEDALPPPNLSDTHRERKRIVPLTRMEGLIRRWVRRAQIAAILGVMLAGAGFGLTTATNILSRQATQDPLPTLPAEPHESSALKAPPVPPAGAIGAVTYSLELPAIDTLKGAQDGALPDPASHQPVVIGTFTTRAEAESALAQIHQVPGFEAAVTVETPSR